MFEFWNRVCEKNLLTVQHLGLTKYTYRYTGLFFLEFKQRAAEHKTQKLNSRQGVWEKASLKIEYEKHRPG